MLISHMCPESWDACHQSPSSKDASVRRCIGLGLWLARVSLVPGRLSSVAPQPSRVLGRCALFDPGSGSV